VSSLLVAEGEPPSVLILISPSTDLWEAIEESRRFVIHVLGAGDRRLADRFAGRDLGDPFVGVPTTPSAWGLVIDGAAARGYCTLTGHTETGWSVLVCGALDRTELTDGPGHPLVHYRGEYRGLGEERSQYRGQE
jgi:flavin reductase (DIM6/NTAB) family NADH-FMN oxidoreductase RutF